MRLKYPKFTCLYLPTASVATFHNHSLAIIRIAYLGNFYIICALLQFLAVLIIAIPILSLQCFQNAYCDLCNYTDMAVRLFNESRHCAMWRRLFSIFSGCLLKGGVNKNSYSYS